MEAFRLGLSAFGGDLNPVAVLISKAMVEIPSSFANLKPINPDSRNSELNTWPGARGLAEDVRYYGELIRKRAWERIGYLYPKVQLDSHPRYGGGGEENTVIAWFWVRTVQSPDPSWNGYVPLMRSGILRDTKKSPIIWSEPIIDIENQTITYRLEEDEFEQEDKEDENDQEEDVEEKDVNEKREDLRKYLYKHNGTISKNGGTCIATGSTITLDYVRQQGRKGNLRKVLIGIVVEGSKGRVYVNPMDLPDVPKPNWVPEGAFSGKSTNLPSYGMENIADVFTDRQLIALTTFSDLLKEVRSAIERDAVQAGLPDEGTRLRKGGQGSSAYADAIMTYLAFAVDKCADYWSTVGNWQNHRESIGPVFARQAIPMTWDFVEANPFSDSSGNWSGQVRSICKALARLPVTGQSSIQQSNALDIISEVDKPIICTDPPYYDNIQYADLSDYFYIWLRRNLSEIWPDECGTLATPKKEEIVANVTRAGSKDKAKEFFESKIFGVMDQISQFQHPNFPATIFYAFKQQANKAGWETFLQGLVDAGLMVTATWPISTEKTGGSRSRKAMLASSVVIVCRPRFTDERLDRSEFLSALRAELPDSIKNLQKQNIAPVDVAQSAIGPGMRIFSRYSKVVETDGSAMSVRNALSLINEVLGEVLADEGAELDGNSQFALTWFEQYGYEQGPYGKAEDLARAKVTTVDNVVRSGIVHSQHGKLRLMNREEMEIGALWSGDITTVWMAVQHLIRHLDRSEMDAAGLVWQLGEMAYRAPQMAYLLYSVCEKKGWSEEAVAYNGLISVWPELVRLSKTPAARQRTTAP